MKRGLAVSVAIGALTVMVAALKAPLAVRDSVGDGYAWWWPLVAVCVFATLAAAAVMMWALCAACIREGDEEHQNSREREGAEHIDLVG
jgi:hypothetical protein